MVKLNFDSSVMDITNTDKRFQWTFDEDFIKNAMSKDNICYKSGGLMCDPWGATTNFYLSIYPNGKDDNQKGQFWIEFNIFMRYDIDIEANLTYYVNSEKGYQQKCSSFFETCGKKSIKFADHEQLLNPNFCFFKDGKFDLMFEMELFYEEKLKIILHQKNFLTQKLIQDKNVDVWIIVEPENQVILEAHKFILQMFSPIFKAIIESQKDSSNKIYIEISGFESKVVKNAIDFCYGSLLLKELELENLLLLYKFYDKYKMDDLKREVQYEMLPKMLPKNIVKVRNDIEECENAEWLKKVCADRIRRYFNERKNIQNIDALIDETKKEVFDKLLIPDFREYVDMEINTNTLHLGFFVMLFFIGMFYFCFQ